VRRNPDLLADSVARGRSWISGRSHPQIIRPLTFDPAEEPGHGAEGLKSVDRASETGGTGPTGGIRFLPKHAVFPPRPLWGLGIRVALTAIYSLISFHLLFETAQLA
jgi:hypothetical protein